MQNPWPQNRKKRITHILGLGFLFTTLILVIGIYLIRKHTVQSEAEFMKRSSEKGKRTQTTRIEKSPNFREIELIGETRPFFTTQIYARVSGYLREVLVDRGDIVREGDTLARIESPETDRAYLSALADFENKKRIAIRSKILRKRNLIAQQDLDVAAANAEMAKAAFGIQEIIKGYESLKAPFGGRITARYVDPGALVQNATNNQSTSQVLYTLSQTDRLRIFVYVDQKDATYVHPGIDAEIYLHERPDFKLSAKVTRVAGELDNKSRTLLTEIDVDNQKQFLVAGSFVQVKLKLTIPSYPQVPLQALITRGNEHFLPIVHENHQVELRKVRVAENTGSILKILAGVQEGEEVAMNLGSEFRLDQKIRPVSMAGQINRIHGEKK